MRSLLGSMLGRVENLAPVPYVSRRQVGLQNTGQMSGDPKKQMEAMSSVSTLFSIVHRTSNATAQVVWKLYRKDPDPNKPKVEREQVDKHPALEVWKRPNPFMPREELVEVSQQHLDLVGEGFWVVGRSPELVNMPLELWPVRPDRMKPITHPSKYLVGWTYCDPDGKEHRLPLEDVIHLRMPNPMDPYRGMGPVQALMTQLDSARYSAEWNRNFFLNSAAPGGVIEVEKRLSDEEFDEFQKRWEEGHRGVARAHRVAMVEQGKWVNRSFSQRDMQFAELHHISRDTIMEAFGIHKHILGIAEDVNRANAEAAAYAFARWLIEPRLVRIRASLNNEFLPLFGSVGESVEFDFDSPVEEDGTAANLERDSKVNALATLTPVGYKAEDLIKWLQLPDIGFEKPEIPMAAGPGGPAGGNGAKPSSPGGGNGNAGGPAKPGKPDPAKKPSAPAK